MTETALLPLCQLSDASTSSSGINGGNPKRKWANTDSLENGN